MSIIKDLCHEFIGRGRPISPEQAAAEADVSERTAQRWADLNDPTEPKPNAIRNMVRSVVLPTEFRRRLLEYFVHGCIDLGVMTIPLTGKAPHPNPLRLSIDGLAVLCELQRAVERAQCELGDGGVAITEAEQAEILRLARAIDDVTAELRRSVNAKAAKPQQRTA